MSDNTKKSDHNEETNSPIVNVDHKEPTWVDQFQKFIVDLTGVVDERSENN